MQYYSLKNRVAFHNGLYPNYPPLVTTDRWLYGVWMIGNDYRNKSTLYGAYPARYLARVLSMFPDAVNTLHLFSGSLPKGDCVRFDLVQGADVQGDAHKLSQYFPKKTFDLILADPPYSDEDANHYGTPMVNRNKVLAECVKVMDDESYIVWLDQVLPMYRKAELQLVGTIGIVRSTNHRFRVASIFKKMT